MKKGAKLTILLMLLVLAIWGYAQITGEKTKDMTLRQRFIHAVYPLLMRLNALSGKSRIISSPGDIPPAQSIYSLRITLIDGEPFDLSTCKGKKLLLVNTASDCGYTPQFEALQALHEQEGDRLIIIGFPSNDFKEQEKKGNADIALFCKRNYGVTFLLAAKTSVRGGPQQHPIYKWLTDPQQNGWNKQPPSWNFAKYLLDENGRLTYYFAPGVDPKDALFQKAIQ